MDVDSRFGRKTGLLGEEDIAQNIWPGEGGRDMETPIQSRVVSIIQRSQAVHIYKAAETQLDGPCATNAG